MLQLIEDRAAAGHPPRPFRQRPGGQDRVIRRGHESAATVRFCIADEDRARACGYWGKWEEGGGTSVFISYFKYFLTGTGIEYQYPAACPLLLHLIEDRAAAGHPPHSFWQRPGG